MDVALRIFVNLAETRRDARQAATRRPTVARLSARQVGRDPTNLCWNSIIFVAAFEVLPAMTPTPWNWSLRVACPRPKDGEGLTRRQPQISDLIRIAGSSWRRGGSARTPKEP